jgi:hypothetical protein
MEAARRATCMDIERRSKISGRHVTEVHESLKANKLVTFVAGMAGELFSHEALSIANKIVVIRILVC